MAGVGDTMTYLEGRIAALEWTCAILIKSMPVVDGTSLVENTLQNVSKHVSPDSEPGFKRGFREGIERVIESMQKLQP